MWKRYFHLTADAEQRMVIETVSFLLSKRSVEHSIQGNHILSTRIPVPLLSWDKRMYSGDNYIGVNPFICVDRVTVDVEPEAEGKTKLDITAIQGRTYLPLLFILLMSLAMWTSAGDTFARWIFLIVAVLYYLFVFHIVIGNLLPREIKRVLQPFDTADRGTASLPRGG